MDGSLTQLCRFFDATRHPANLMALATILHTDGSTYRKAGARILIAQDGSSSSLLSGGCLEGELREHAERVIGQWRAQRVRFDTRNDDPLWGVGLGCEGAMEVWVEPVGPRNDYGPMPYLQHCLAVPRAGALATVVGGAANDSDWGRFGGLGMPSSDGLGEALAGWSAEPAGLSEKIFQGRRIQVSVSKVTLPAQILVCGAGRDAMPVCEAAAALGWLVSVVDHRPAYAKALSFPGARQVLLARPEEMALHLDLRQFDAGIIMSHHLESDVRYLDALSRSPMRYIGLLGPRTRRERILAELGRPLGEAESRLFGPVGLDIGATTPESIALAIVAQMQAQLAQRPGGHFDRRPRG